MLLALSAITLSIMSCGTGAQSTAPAQTSSTGVATMDVGKQFKMPVNAKGNTVEQEQILKKQMITSDPTRVLWMHLIALDGHMYQRIAVCSKITSSGKRLEPTTCVAGYVSDGSGGHSEYGATTPDKQHYTNELEQVDGTYGSSNAYVYWFDPMDNYFEKGDGYLLSSIPIDIENPVDKITGLFRISAEAQAAQKNLEKALAETLKKNNATTK